MQQKSNNNDPFMEAIQFLASWFWLLSFMFPQSTWKRKWWKKRQTRWVWWGWGGWNIWNLFWPSPEEKAKQEQQQREMRDENIKHQNQMRAIADSHEASRFTDRKRYQF